MFADQQGVLFLLLVVVNTFRFHSLTLFACRGYWTQVVVTVHHAVVHRARAVRRAVLSRACTISFAAGVMHAGALYTFICLSIFILHQITIFTVLNESVNNHLVLIIS